MQVGRVPREDGLCALDQPLRVRLVGCALEPPFSSEPLWKAVVSTDMR